MFSHFFPSWGHQWNNKLQILQHPLICKLFAFPFAIRRHGTNLSRRAFAKTKKKKKHDKKLPKGWYSARGSNYRLDSGQMALRRYAISDARVIYAFVSSVADCGHSEHSIQKCRRQPQVGILVVIYGSRPSSARHIYQPHEDKKFVNPSNRVGNSGTGSKKGYNFFFLRYFVRLLI